MRQDNLVLPKIEKSVLLYAFKFTRLASLWITYSIDFKTCEQGYSRWVNLNAYNRTVQFLVKLIILITSHLFAIVVDMVM